MTGHGTAPASPGTTGWHVPVRACILCGQAGPDVRMGLVRWREGEPYGYGPRCRDHDACADRVHANGDPWPVDDGRPVGVLPEPAIPRGMIYVHSPRNDPTPDPQPYGDELDFGEAPE